MQPWQEQTGIFQLIQPPAEHVLLCSQLKPSASGEPGAMGMVKPC